MKYTFELGTYSDLETVYMLIDERIDWMDNVGIQQWNVTDYWKCYPKSYYQKAVDDRCLYVLKDSHHVIGAVVLREKDKRWDDNETAYYIHNLVTSTNIRGAGEEILKKCSELAFSDKKCYLRLDCSRTNYKLNSYYEQQGFVCVGTCSDVNYHGNKREKRL